ncbi:phosphoribosylanthranilate isomerase [Archaeoglobus neptunius]|uniref:phosphoribosylanthranilate isomerase n=1 Tax=Archaeoglobus neptunius TaxID=2798580 RepID=UPI001927C198|nr:phosphoribosylanthranilate isomerase [Archaeoglobus neptunius]
MIVKICGVRSIEELEVVERYADVTGVVVRSNSKRCVDLKKAREIISSASIPVFAVSTASSLEEWMEVVSKLECGLVQVHSPMLVEDFERLKEHVRVMKAFIVGDSPGRVIQEIESYSPHFILLDSGCGSGVVHDWSVSREVAKRYGVFLAGGLNPGNVEEAIREVNPIGVDVSSGVEENGVKSEILVREFVRRAKNEVW